MWDFDLFYISQSEIYEIRSCGPIENTTWSFIYVFESVLNGCSRCVRGWRNAPREALFAVFCIHEDTDEHDWLELLWLIWQKREGVDTSNSESMASFALSDSRSWMAVALYQHYIWPHDFQTIKRKLLFLQSGAWILLRCILPVASWPSCPSTFSTRGYLCN